MLRLVIVASAHLRNRETPDDPVVLGIETSCDDSSAAIYQPSRGLLAHRSSSREDSHRPYGGVVPELASRDHIGSLLPLVQAVLRGRPPDAIACTAGPGLAGCLAVGVSLAQSLAWSWRIRLAAVHHLEGHLLSPFLDAPPGFDFPYVALLASGGHTALYDVAGRGSYRMLGETLDDAAGEAFDKTASILGLPYPGAAKLERLAGAGDPDAAGLPVPMLRQKGLDFSFSGLKTAAKRCLEQGCSNADIAAGFQAAAVATLAGKTELALRRTRRRRLAVVGGVARNLALRSALAAIAAGRGVQIACPAPEFCTDNAAMIALAGCHHLAGKYDLSIRPRWPLAQACGSPETCSPA